MKMNEKIIIPQIYFTSECFSENSSPRCVVIKYFSILTHLVERNYSNQQLYLSPGGTLVRCPVLLNSWHFLQELMKLLAEQMDSLLTLSVVWPHSVILRKCTQFACESMFILKGEKKEHDCQNCRNAFVGNIWSERISKIQGYS